MRNNLTGNVDDILVDYAEMSGLDLKMLQRTAENVCNFVKQPFVLHYDSYDVEDVLASMT